MAGFTSLALGALGFMAAKKLVGGKKPEQQQITAPGPSDAASQAPAPPLVNPAEQNAQALAAAGKVRKSAARGAAITRPLPKAGTLPVRGTPKSLIGY